ncbi:MAG: hypothetical protein GEU86_10525 [Actinophytocola sp.]|nr:hypothetical protein [Actinophytocola sp.]
MLASAGLISDGWAPGFAVPLIWVLVGLFALGTLVNAISRAKLERVWAPVSLVIAVSCGIIAAGM